jgi:hypothetical protein
MPHLRSFASKYQGHVQLGAFLESDNHNWIMVYNKFLPQNTWQWGCLASHAQDPRIQMARIVGDNSALQTQNAALHHLVNHSPCLESMLMQHVNATVPEGLGQQQDVLPPSLHAIACNSHLKTLPSGRRNLKLDIISVDSLRAASVELPKLQGLDSLQLTVEHKDDLWPDYQSCSFLSRMTALKEIRLIVKNNGPTSIFLNITGLTCLQHLDLS